MTTDNPLAAEGGGEWPAPRALPHAAWRASYDQLAVRMLRHDPATAMKRLGALGAIASRWGWQGPRRSAVRTLFPHLNDQETAAVARASTALLFKNRAAVALVARHGLEALAALVTERDAAAPDILTHRSSGAILLGFHAGAHSGIGAALHRWRIPVFSVRETSLRDADARARALKLAVDVLREGGVVLAVGDGPRGANTPPLTCLGRQIRLRRGPFMLARVTSAPVMPAVACWTRQGELAVRIHQPLLCEGRDVEAALEASAARWLDDYLQTHPGELWPYTFRNFLGAPSSLEQHLIPERLVVQQPL